jgi:hypothetical protein
MPSAARLSVRTDGKILSCAASSVRGTGAIGIVPHERK